VNRAVPVDRLMATVHELCRKIIAKSLLALRGIKHLVNGGRAMDVRAGLEMEIRYMHDYATRSRDAMEGLLAFSEKRRPRFSGE
jgi:enoyl-CoA hydratase/carnithine racemase